jgi:His-Xaa-Ser system protein HxsD
MDLDTRIDAGRRSAVFSANPKVYNLEALMQAAYTFVDRCYVLLDKDDDGRFVVRLKTRQNAADDVALEALAGEFQNELLHAAFRDRLTRRTQKVRELIVGRALFSAGGGAMEPTAGATGPEMAARPQDALPDVPLPDLPEEVLRDLEKLEQMDYMDDPLGIAVPWEEKYQKGKRRKKGAGVEAGAEASDAAAGAEETGAGPGDVEAGNR